MFACALSGAIATNGPGRSKLTDQGGLAEPTRFVVPDTVKELRHPFRRNLGGQYECRYDPRHSPRTDFGRRPTYLAI
jgi:hypothetical protein